MVNTQTVEQNKYPGWFKDTSGNGFWKVAKIAGVTDFEQGLETGLGIARA